MFLIMKEEIYEVSGERMSPEGQLGERFNIRISSLQSGLEKRIDVSLSRRLLASNNMVGFDKGDFAMRAACRAIRRHEEVDEVSVITSNFDDLMGKKVSDEEIDSELAKLTLWFFKSQLAAAQPLTIADLFVSTDFHLRDIQRRIQYFHKRGWIRWAGLESYLFEITKAGFPMMEALAGSMQVSNSENKYFQRVPLPKDVKEPFVFVLMPFGDKEINQKMYHDVIKPTVEKELGIRCVRSDEVTAPGVINNQIFTLIRRAKFIIAETTSKNANVFYEIGMAHAFDKDVFLFCERKKGPLPFDITTHRAVFYDDLDDLKQKIVENLKHHIT
jgi:hypothetical protein